MKEEKNPIHNKLQEWVIINPQWDHSLPVAEPAVRFLYLRDLKKVCSRGYSVCVVHEGSKQVSYLPFSPLKLTAPRVLWLACPNRFSFECGCKTPQLKKKNPSRTNLEECGASGILSLRTNVQLLEKYIQL